MSNPDNITISRKWLLNQIDECERMAYTSHSRSTLTAYQQVLKQQIPSSYLPDTPRVFSKKILAMIEEEQMIENVLLLSCQHFDISREKLLAGKISGRRNTVIEAKQTAIWMLRNTTTLTYQEIATMFNLSNHSSVIFATRNVEGYAKVAKNQSGKVAMGLLAQLTGEKFLPVSK